ncbi:RcnB family protein [Erwinia sp. E_sp_B01_9]|uniref:RcnB family protein n=1 Tax=Erwinia sp. E_sp_B01_9 TaxID=3039403 RepID=UPI003D9BDBED
MKKSGIIALSALLFATTSLSAFAGAHSRVTMNSSSSSRLNVRSRVSSRAISRTHGNQAQGNQQRQSQANQHAAKPQHVSEQRQTQHHDFHQGRPLPKRYRGDGYQVTDWHKRGLKAPPAGHRWQNVDGNYVLIAVATGVITSIITHQ